MKLLSAAILLLLLGLVCGVLLALCAYFLAPKTDGRLAAVRDCLPGANCGGCGYPGCDGYAKAILEENADLCLCSVGGSKTSAALAELLQKEASYRVTPIAVVHCRGNGMAPGSAAQGVTYDGPSTCAAAAIPYKGTLSCASGCLGFGDCAEVCPVNAISLREGKAVVSPEICVGCGLCVKTCPKRLISLRKRKTAAANLCMNHTGGVQTRSVCQNGCIACRKCEKLCPVSAIRVENCLASVDERLCIACGLCVKNCPTGCLAFVTEGKTAEGGLP